MSHETLDPVTTFWAFALLQRALLLCCVALEMDCVLQRGPMLLDTVSTLTLLSLSLSHVHIIGPQQPSSRFQSTRLSACPSFLFHGPSDNRSDSPKGKGHLSQEASVFVVVRVSRQAPPSFLPHAIQKLTLEARLIRLCLFAER